MAIPVATTTITVTRPATGGMYDEPYGSGSTETVATGVRAVIDTPSSGAHGGRETVAGGEQTIVAARLFCDPCGLGRLDHVTDDTTGQTYRVVWHLHYPPASGVEHTQAELEQVEGLL